MSENKLDKRFGSVAVEKKFITIENLYEAMKIQIQDDLSGSVHRPIGQILWELGVITNEQIGEVLKTMGI